MKRTAIVSDPLFEKHDPGPYHPECPARLEAITARLQETGLDAELVHQTELLPKRTSDR